MSTMCDTCGLPQELCICEDMSKSNTNIEVYTEERKFNDVTIASGFDGETDIDELSSELKSKFACGGTIQNDEIELQGDHAQSLSETLENKGFEIV